MYRIRQTVGFALLTAISELQSHGRMATQISRVALRISDFSTFSRRCCVDFHPIFPNLQSQPTKEAHVPVGQPYQRESCDEIASPVIEQQLETVPPAARAHAWEKLNLGTHALQRR